MIVIMSPHTDTVCKTVRWLSAKLGPTVASSIRSQKLAATAHKLLHWYVNVWRKKFHCLIYTFFYFAILTKAKRATASPLFLLMFSACRAWQTPVCGRCIWGEQSGECGNGQRCMRRNQLLVTRTAGPVLDCLIYIAQLYGEPVLTYQYLPYIGYLVRRM